MSNFTSPPSREIDTDELRWAPKSEGHGTLVGTLVERTDDVMSSFGTTGSVLQIKDAAGVWSVMAFPTRLRECVIHFDPKVGDRVGVKYVGPKQTKNGRAMDEYEMFVERASAPAALPVATPVAQVKRGPAPAPVADDEMPF